MKHKQLGFTLIELMITVAIVGILAGIAYPSYQNSVMKSRRADVKGVLLGLANAMERHFTETNSYEGAAIAAANTGVPGIYNIPDETATYYNVTISDVPNDSSYTLSAEPIGAQASDACGTLTIKHTGAKSADTTDCW